MHLILIDGSGFIFRAFHALPPLTKKDGTPVGAVYGFCNMLLKVLTDNPEIPILVVFDAARKTFRQDIYAEYKAHRPPAPTELISQFQIIREACHAFGVPWVESLGFEADDLIASYTKEITHQNGRVTIISSDKDLMQLVKDNVNMFDPIKNKIINREAVIEKFGVPPEKVIDVQSLCGDSSDNIPGVPSIGIKTAAQLINDYENLENLLANLETIKQPKRREILTAHKEDALLSKQLVTLKDDVILPLALDEISRNYDDEVLEIFLKTHEFSNMRHKLFVKKKPTAPLADNITIQSKEELINFLSAVTDSLALVCHGHRESPMDAELFGIGLSFKGFSSYHNAYIPLTDLNRPDILKILEPYLCKPSILKIGHNIKQDMVLLKKYGIECITPFDDLMVMSYVLDTIKHSHSIEQLSEIYLDQTLEKITEQPNQLFQFLPLFKQLHEALFKTLHQERLYGFYHTVEKPLIPVIASMEYQGISLDQTYLRHIGQEFYDSISTLSDKIHALAGMDFNIGSSKQLGEVLFDHLKLLDKPPKTKGGAYATDADVLEELANQGHEIATHLLQWRMLSKLTTTYVEGLIKAINPITKRIHTSFSLAGTATGRLSSSNPNIQNIPIRNEEGRKIRQSFVASPGYQLVSLDYSQIELRLLAHIGHIKSLQEAFYGGIDIHTAVAQQLFGSSDPDTRRRAKTINFGILYGMSAFGLSQQLGITQTQASEYINHYFANYPGIRHYMEDMKEKAKAFGFVETILGRRCHIPGIHDSRYPVRQMAERQAINAPIQGSNADIIKKAMSKIQHIMPNDESVKLLIQVHDELLFEIKENIVSTITPKLKTCMEQVVLLNVPLVVDAKIGQDWNRMEKAK